jgi:hypothetical protein
MKTVQALALAALLTLTATAGNVPAQEKTMRHATGEFDVQVTPRPLDGPAEDPSFSRYALVKQLRGDLVGTGHGQMLASGGPERSAGAYVAIERITCRLDGREGSFVLQHRGVMDAAGYEMHVMVVPESGTGGLAGITGTFQITIEGGKHRYDFEYELPGLDKRGP